MKGAGREKNGLEPTGNDPLDTMSYSRGRIMSKIPKNGEMSKPYERWVEIDVDSSDTLNGSGIACCVTVYNEDGEALLVSLLGLIRNAQYLKMCDVGFAKHEMALCVIVDGADRMSASFFKYAQQCKFIDARCKDGGSDIHVYETYTDGGELCELLRECTTSGRSNSWIDSNQDYIRDKLTKGAFDYDENLKVRVVFYIKSKNLGKLDSHWHFFEVICQFLNPKYCVQMDVGTNPNVDATKKMLEVICRREHIGVVACRSYIASPKNHLNIIGVWQFSDMLRERFISWPTEALLGYLSVMPGQMCLMKWEAVDSRKCSTSDFGSSESYQDRHCRTLKSYYRGLEENGPFESNMFLAEDRVLGFEIVHNKKNRWRIDYAPRAEATTDPCNSWAELLQQRRRWICSSFSCKIWFLIKLKEYMFGSGKSWIDKSRMLLSGIYFLLDILVTWFLFGIMGSCVTAIYVTAQRDLKFDSLLFDLNFCAVVGVILVSAFHLFISLGRKIEFFVEKSLSFTVALQSIALLFLGLVAFLRWAGDDIIKTILLLNLFLFLGFILNCLFFSKNLAKKMAGNIFVYGLVLPSVSFLMQCFAFCNMDDVSWGTKGLTLTVARGATSQRGASKYKRRFFWFRWGVILGQVSSNVGLYWLLLYMGVSGSLMFLAFMLCFSLALLAVSLIACAVINSRDQTFKGGEPS